MHIILFLPQANIIDSNKDCQHFPVILKVNLRMLYYVHTNYTCILLLMYIDLLLHIKIIILQQHNTLYIYYTELYLLFKYALLVYFYPHTLQLFHQVGELMCDYVSYHCT